MCHLKGCGSVQEKNNLSISISNDIFSVLKDAITELQFKIDRFDIHYDHTGVPFYYDCSGQTVYDGDIIDDFMYLPELEQIIQCVEKDYHVS